MRNKYRVVKDGKGKFNVEKKIRFRYWVAEQAPVLDPMHPYFLTYNTMKDKTFDSVLDGIEYIEKQKKYDEEMAKKGEVVYP